MRILRIAGAAFACVAICPALFLASYAAIVITWTVYADLSGVLGLPGPATRDVALFWAPLGGLIVGLAGSLVMGRMFVRRSRKSTRGRLASNASAAPTLGGEAVLLGHADLLRQLHQIASENPGSDPQPGLPDRPRATIDWSRQKKVA